MIRVTYITLDKTDGSHVHIFSVFEQMIPDTQDAGDVGNRSLLPYNARPSGHSPNKDNLTFHARILPDTVNWLDVVVNPLQNLDVDGNAVRYHGDVNMDAVECDIPSLFDFHHTAKSTLTAVLPYRNSGGRISRYCDSTSKVRETIMGTTQLRKQLQNLTLRFMGYDLTQYSEHIGNVHLITWNPLFKDVDNWIDQNTGRVHLHFLYHDNIYPGIVVRAMGQNKAGALLFDKELCSVKGQKYIDEAIPTIPDIITLRYYDENGVLWMDCSTTGYPISIMGNMMMMGTPKSITALSKKGRARTIQTQKGTAQHFGISHAPTPRQTYLKEEIEHQRFISDEQSLQFVFFDANKDHPEQNERKATRIVRSILKKDSRTCFICDPYFDDYAFDKFIWPLEDMGREVHIVNCLEFLDDENKLKDTINRLHQHIKREQVKCHVITGKGVLHDRFILLDNDGWLIGSSFNEFGNRASTIVKMPKSACVTLRKQVEDWINDNKTCKDLFEL